MSPGTQWLVAKERLRQRPAAPTPLSSRGPSYPRGRRCRGWAELGGALGAPGPSRTRDPPARGLFLACAPASVLLFSGGPQTWGRSPAVCAGLGMRGGPQGGPEPQSHRPPGLRSPHHGVGHLQAAVALRLKRCGEGAEDGPVHLPVGAARQAQDKPLSLKLQGQAGKARVAAAAPPGVGFPPAPATLASGRPL